MEQESITQPNSGNPEVTPATTSAAVYKPRLFATLDKTWEIAKGKIWHLLGVDLMVLVTLAVALIIAMIPVGILVGLTLLIKIPAVTVLVAAIGILAIIATFTVVTLWGFIASVKILQSEQNLTVRQSLSEAHPLVRKYLATYVIAMLVILGGYLLFIIPGIIASISTAFVLFVAITENKTGMEALARSRELVRGRWWSVALTFVGVTVILLAAMIMTGMSSGSPLMLIITPLMYVFMYVLYRQLHDNYNGQPAGNPWFYKLFIAVAIIAVAAGIIGATVAAGTDWDKFKAHFESAYEYDEEEFDWHDGNFENKGYYDRYYEDNYNDNEENNSIEAPMGNELMSS